MRERQSKEIGWETSAIHLALEWGRGGQWWVGARCDRGGQRMVEDAKMGQMLIFGRWSGPGGPA